MYFLIGIKGKGMLSLAKFLFDMGVKVEGYDDNCEKDDVYFELQATGINIYENLSNELLKDKFIIVSSAVNIECLLDKYGSIADFKYYYEFVADLTKKMNTISVCGSFGKTTTSVFLAQILNELVGCNYIVGDGSGYYNDNNKLFVLESCEYKKHFLNYQPSDLIITNIGSEHLDCYTDFDDIVDTFLKFSNNCLGKKVIFGDLLFLDYSKFEGDVTFYGYDLDNDVVIEKVVNNDIETIVVLDYFGKKIRFSVPLRLGKHQVLDLVGAIVMASLQSCDINRIISVVSNVRLPEHRFVQKKIDGIDVICDYCGHYAGIESNIRQLRMLYPNKKINVIFEPISYIRMIKTCDLVCSALNEFDFVFVCDIVPLRENNIEQFNFSLHDIIDKLENSQYFDKNNELFFDDNDVVAIFAPVSNNLIEKKIRHKKNRS